MTNSSSSSELEQESLLCIEMKGNHRNQQQRRAAWSAAAVLSAVGFLFVLGIFLFFKSMYIYSNQPSKSRTQPVVLDVMAESARDIATMSHSHENIVREMLRRKTEEESSSTQQQQQSSTTDKPSVKSPNDHFNVSFLVDNTPSGGTKGLVIITVMPELAPLGARRFAELVEAKYFDGNRFFRVLHNFMAQFGVNGDPEVSKQWRNRVILDDPVKATNKRGAISFATSGKDTRTTQLFINTAKRGRLQYASIVILSSDWATLIFV